MHGRLDPTAPLAPYAPAGEGPAKAAAAAGARAARLSGGGWSRLLAFLGPGYLVAVGYVDPGNWATDIAAGSAFGYRLLSVVLLASLAAMLLQTLAVRLGIGSGLDLAQACRERYRRPTRLALWLLAEAGIVACDLAELVGTALGLKLLFHIPMILGAVLTALDVFLVLALQRFGFRRLEAFIIALMALVAACFLTELVLARPSLAAAAAGLAPDPAILAQPAALYLSVGVLGATVMPHNLYLHSAIVRTRRFAPTPEGRAQAARLATLDSTVALALAFLLNAAILLLAAAAFHRTGRTAVTGIEQAHRLLAPLLGAPVAAPLFALALLASGQNSAVTATMAGQTVMEGFVRLRITPWKRRLITRGLALGPALLVIGLFGDGAAGGLLVASQVALSLQLPFAVIPLIQLTAERRRMGALASPAWLTLLAGLVATAIVAANLALLWGMASHA